MRELLQNSQPILLALQEKIAPSRSNCKAPPLPINRADWAK